MKKIFAFVMLAGLGSTMSAQYMIIGKDSISLADFKKEYQYGLQNTGIEKTLSATEDFILLQQFAADKKADTAASFRERMMEKEADLREQYFYPKQVLDPVLNDYVKDNQTEKQVQIFMVPKTEGDTNNYQQIYNDVKAGKITMDDAITKYTKGAPKPLFIKPGSVDSDLYTQLKSLPNNSYTKLQDSPGYIAFAKVLNSRPSLGYMIFGTISFPKDANSETVKNKIYTDLKAGKSFQEVAKLYGANEHEKDNGGVVMGSPTLPDEVYELFKGKKAGYYSPEPLLFGENYFVFNIYNVEPYVITDKNRDFFLRDMNGSLYNENLQDKMLAYLKSDPTYKEFPAFQNVKKSYQAFNAAKDDTVLYQYKKDKTTVGDLKKLIGDKKAEAEKLTPALWSDALSGVNTQDLMRFYSADFTNQKDIKKSLNEFKRGLYSDYIFSKFLNEEVDKHPEWLTDHYNKNKSKYMWGNRADGRVAIIADDKLTKEIEKDIKNPKNWETLKAKYYGKLNDKKQILVNFEKGEMSEDADVFTKYKVPFKTGVHQTKMEERTLVIAIDKILPPSQMTQAEAAELLKDAVNEERLKAIIAEQKAKTKIVIQPEFRKDLEKNFKK
ncbi:peptidylprolyl isomerase [Chryseobacterium sp. HSC-36S06]|uniref:peptidylprolyl isomerase n=1 Tax=Chryseobacterium sp. HSC-36S06 TaxID=2910970 RepID=UPI00209FA0B9|nr:peptidylprolyl isomerase [Chryseobacterium sp. HSC-36S06]MCP2037837.1 peptidyl-prolyl cis-trans isomerase SurA [Chryseobacterium sp. HSC-36S06]